MVEFDFYNAFADALLSIPDDEAERAEEMAPVVEKLTRDLAMKMASAVVREYANWLVAGSDVQRLQGDSFGASLTTGQTVRRYICNRYVASTWVLFPEMWGGASLRQIARWKLVNTQKSQLAKAATEFSEHFQIYSRGQRIAKDGSHQSAEKTRSKRSKKPASADVSQMPLLLEYDLCTSIEKSAS